MAQQNVYEQSRLVSVQWATLVAIYSLQGRVLIWFQPFPGLPELIRTRVAAINIVSTKRAAAAATVWRRGAPRLSPAAAAVAAAAASASCVPRLTARYGYGSTSKQQAIVDARDSSNDGAAPQPPALPPPPYLGGAQPSSRLNAASLAYLGDAVWEVRRGHALSLGPEKGFDCEAGPVAVLVHAPAGTT